VKVIILGGGPAGLYFALLLKKANPAHDITLIERNPASATYGWGVVFSDRTLASFREADPKTYKEITDSFVLWEAIDVYYRDEAIRIGGNIFAGMSRRVLLNILQNRCAELGVNLKFEIDITDLTQITPLISSGEFDLMVAADGVNSLIRKTYAQIFKPDLDIGKSKFIWFGTTKVFDAFTFIFRENEHGLFQVHAYPFDGTTGTFIVECEEETWQRAGLAQASEADSIAYCEKLFAKDLGQARLLSNRSLWVNFITVKNKTWRHGNIVLLGDSAHTAHFSIGSGTKLAMEDAIALANVFEQHDDVETALNEYELERRPRVEALQEAARESRIYFENISRTLYLEPPQFTFHLMSRSGRITYDNLRQRDPHFVEAVDRWFASSPLPSPLLKGGGESPLPVSGRGAEDVGDETRANLSALEPKRERLGEGLLIAPPPLFNPFQLRNLTLSNRVVLSPNATYSASDGLPDDVYVARLHRRALGGAALVLTEPAAVSREARITPGDVGIYCDEHGAAWDRITDFIHANSSAKVTLKLNHAGRRGSTRPRSEGLDRPLRVGNWPLLSASALPYSAHSQVPRAMDRADMDQVCGDFVQATHLAHEAGFDMLQLHFGHGYLLASFISPLTNQRDDEYGGSLENRLRFPLELFDAVRAAWPEEKPLSVALTATDCVEGGFDLDEAVATAKLLKAQGCDIIEVLAGQTTLNANPAYGPGFLTPFSDWLHSKAGIATIVSGHLTTTDEVNTILAAGRADLCLMNPPHLND
jgi:anthraniloyl-CoA monooxygenase